MKTRSRLTGLVAGAALIAMSMTAIAETPEDDHAAHHPEVEATAPETDMPMMPGMEAMEGMMTPEMMQMMMRMMADGGMYGMMGGMRGDGMMGQGMMDDGETAPGVMGRGMMRDGMMGGGMPRSSMMGMDGMPMGPMMRSGPQGHGHGLGPHVLYGMAHGAPSEMTPARVETFLSHLLERHGNPRLELGEITEGDDGSIIAEIVTVDGSLVQRLAFNRFPGLFRQID
ncbi:hypothetical protein [Roseinatronobacter bogoriensis]|uniref:Uncharacterized protein n=1 Tax=Roseinatronobacter bogoriensis subsp. barguzinensis TaxID=441209 RepID=A0A2K8KFT7_9RHOB|nr:hypothetical protein [Rhodobaca]ATX65030.1 hypothetical protein BG454_03610 [Rhodobaca barguzinensis]MBB4208864.1 hypothetical protein [Rhodobaca bogoriensis DSM 18756]TDW37869.1 hypothetical protein LY39_02222 [Rhodobaca barguzinensis]TDY69962.1 hypothetical protein EV660_103358 [Rhodobaca bogoriensis DSM 18756]